MKPQKFITNYRGYLIYQEPLCSKHVVRTSENDRALEVCDSLDEAKDMIDLRIKTD